MWCFISCESAPKNGVDVNNEANEPLGIVAEQVLRHPLLLNPKLSPDAAYISEHRPWRTRTNLFLRTTDNLNKNPVLLSQELDANIFWHVWQDPQHIIYARTIDPSGSNEIIRINIVSRQKQLLFQTSHYLEFSDDVIYFPFKLLFSMSKDATNVFDYYRLDLSTLKLEVVGKNTTDGAYSHWTADHSGLLRVAIATRAGQRELVYRRSERDMFTSIFTIAFNEVFWPLRFSEDNAQLLAFSNRGREYLALVKVDFATRTEQVLIEKEQQDLDLAIFASNKQKILGACASVSQECNFLDKQREKVQQSLRDKLGIDASQDFKIVNADAAGKNMIVFHEGATESEKYWLYRVEKDQLDFIDFVRPWLKKRELLETMPFQVKTKDGLDLRLHLTMPKLNGSILNESNSGAESNENFLNARINPANVHKIDPAERPPLIVIFEKDAWVAYRPHLDAVAQYFAAQGYAVLRIISRGVFGYGKQHWKAGFKNFGATKIDDIAFGVDFIKKQGLIDHDQVYLFGEELGGFLALASLSRHPRIFKAAAVHNPISSLLSYMKMQPVERPPQKALFTQYFGDPATELTLLSKQSPYYNLNPIVGAVRISQDEDLDIVYRSENKKMIETLQNAKRQAWMVEYRSSDFASSHAALQRRMMEILDFYDQLYLEQQKMKKAEAAKKATANK
ncbi:MAG: prolyl oligopeptidase family serine peptidase [Oligoflexales bacterium]|nr:prolyl oligopeptidase family serine peptidase [Oligoflexales bacterium]